MTNEIKSYKYSCRKCAIRQRCINDKGFGPGLKTAVARRFADGTDTFETWDMLQEDCLLIRHELQDAAARERKESGLVRRLREARQQAKPPQPQEPPQPAEPRLAVPIPRVEPPPEGMTQPGALGRAATAEITPCGFTIAASKRLVRIPMDGDIVLGRFEHGFSNPPDVDLAYEDGEIPSVSRRHALVTARGGTHWIEDMGSSNGTYVNGHQVALGQSVELAPNDRILLGRCRLVHSPLPHWIEEPDPRVEHTTWFIVTHTGQKIKLPERPDIIVGRPDPTLNYVPDVDLSLAGDIAMYISRRHVKIVSRAGWHFVEEIGSAAGTRLNGRAIRVGEAPVMMQHGDQLWLGGCVLAYEWKLL